MQNKKGKVIRSFYNVSFGLLSQLITIILGIIVPKLLIVNLGSESNGLISSINQIYVYVNLLEAGVGAATLQALYGLVAKNDHQEINRVLSATRHYYDRVSLFYLVAVIGLSFIYPFTVSSSISKLTMSLVILFTGLSGVINFKYQAKFKLLLQAEGKNYIVSNLTTFTNILTSVAKIVLIRCGFSIVVIQGIYCVISLVQMVYYALYERNKYQWIDYYAEPNFEAIKGKNSALVHQVSGLIFNNTDIILLTYFCGLSIVSVYTLYNLIIGVVNTLLNVVGNSVLFIIGQAYKTEKQNFTRIYEAYESALYILIFSAYSTLISLIVPFLRLYTEGMSDANYLDAKLILLFIIVQVLSGIKVPGANIITVAGHFKQTQSRSILESTINIFASIILVGILGYYGVLIGTICALLYRSNDIIIYSRSILLNSKSIRTYLKLIPNILTIICVYYFSTSINLAANNYFELLLKAFIAGLLYLIVFSVENIAINKDLLLYAKHYSNKFRENRGATKN